MPRLVDPARIAAQPWKNGAGQTRELIAWPDADAWQVRVSVADVAAPAPFSTFEGVERWFAVVEGAGVELRVDDAVHRLGLGSEPLRFDGAAAAFATPVDGPTRDLNLMLRRAAGSMVPVEDGAAWSPDADRCGLFSGVPGRCVADREVIDVAAGVLLWFDDAPGQLAFTKAGAGVAAACGWWLAATARHVAND